jgi:hypothetical protein
MLRSFSQSVWILNYHTSLCKNANGPPPFQTEPLSLPGRAPPCRCSTGVRRGRRAPPRAGLWREPPPTRSSIVSHLRNSETSSLTLCRAAQYKGSPHGTASASASAHPCPILCLAAADGFAEERQYQNTALLNKYLSSAVAKPRYSYVLCSQ